MTKRYSNVPALDVVDLMLPQGTVFGLPGPNGVGSVYRRWFSSSDLILCFPTVNGCPTDLQLTGQLRRTPTARALQAPLTSTPVPTKTAGEPFWITLTLAFSVREEEDTPRARGI
jgi:hypothetical protein